MADLIEFLRARLDEDERDALAVQSADIYDVPASSEDAAGAAFRRLASAPWLADIAAKRALVDQILNYEAKIDGEWGCCHDATRIAAGLCEETPVNEIHGLRLLAAPWHDHPEFDPSWVVIE